MASLHPTHGVRVLLDLASSDERAAVYRMELHAPERAWACEVRIVIAGGALELSPLAPTVGEGEPDPWMLDAARGFLRTLCKNHAAERDWPKRQLRWRDRR